MNKIISIEEVHNMETLTLKKSNCSQLGISSRLNDSYDGYKVKTEKDEYLILIDNGQNCCEDWGYFDTNDNSQEFIGAELQDIELVDKALSVESLKEKMQFGTEYVGICFVNFRTDKDVFQLAVYNSHNGYYGHSIFIAKNGEIIVNDTL